nr:hypothetical protein [Tanacetum cinerariifolium]
MYTQTFINRHGIANLDWELFSFKNERIEVIFLRSINARIARRQTSADEASRPPCRLTFLRSIIGAPTFSSSSWGGKPYICRLFRSRGNLNLECAVLPARRSNEAIPDEATANIILPFDRNALMRTFHRKVFLVSP